MRFCKNISKFFRCNETLIMLVILALFFVIQLSGLFGFYAYGWDESVYLQMSRNIATGGEHGIMEEIRPLLFPAMLIPFFRSMFASRLLVLMMATTALWLLYLISKELLPDSGIGWLFPALLAIYPAYYINSTSIMTDVPALFFNAFSMLLFLRRRYALSGAAGFVSFMLRPTFAIFLPIMFIALFFIEKRNDTIRKVISFAAGIASALPLMLLNVYVFYGKTGNILSAAIYPMIIQLKDSTSSPYLWYYGGGAIVYFRDLIAWSLLSVFCAAGVMILLFRLSRIPDSKTGLIMRKNLMALAFFIFPTLYLALILKRIFIRYFLFAMPWLVYFMFFGIVGLGSIIKWHDLNRKSRGMLHLAYCIIIAVLILSAIINSVSTIRNEYHAPEELYTTYYFALENVSEDSRILTAVPMIKTDAEIVIGYDNDRYFYDKLRQSSDYDYIYYTSNWFPCRQNDSGCLRLRQETKEYLK
ncbi:MAG: phospholipid carrier-dependent glycosyltransferase, partial [Candidatus Woesearchaeota archaeon]|nr:phospholipid carrier-dependent glycosyltransferase [Candidatus Woesearchaeota archaeon]